MNPKLLALPLAAAMVLAPGAAQALAAPSLPATDTLHTIECDSGPGSTIPPLQLFSVDAATGLLTAVGSGDAGTPDGDRCGGRAAQDPTTSRVYFVDYAHDPDSLSMIDPTTGTTTVVGAFTRADRPDGLFTVWALAIDASGTAFATDGTAILTLDLATAELTVLGDGDSGAAGSLTVLAVDPATQQLYGITSNAATPTVYEIDSATGEATAHEQIAQRNVYGLAFDSTGLAWVARYDAASGDTKLATVDIADWAATYADVGPLRLPGAPDYDFYVESLFVTSTAWPAAPGGGDAGGDGNGAGQGGETPGGGAAEAGASPQLAATGADPLIAGGLLGVAVLALLAGATLLVVRRRAGR